MSRGARRGPFRSAKEAIGAWEAARGHTMTGLLELWMARVFVGGRLGRAADHTRLIILAQLSGPLKLPRGSPTTARAVYTLDVSCRRSSCALCASENGGRG